MKKDLLHFSQLLLYSFLITVLCYASAFSQAVPSTKQSGSTFSSDGSVGTVSWSNPGNASDSNNTYASATLGSSDVSEFLRVTNFGFNIPSTATIEGIEVYVDFYADNADAIQDNSIRLLDATGTIVGDDRARSAGIYWPTSEATVTYGSNSIDWLPSGSWTPSEINDPNFGVVISAEAAGGASTANINHVSIMVYFIAEDYYYDGTGDPSDVTNWGTNQDGTGTQPANFLQDGSVFHLVNGDASVSANWTVSGSGSKVIIGDGTNARTLTVDDGVNLSADIEVKNNATYMSNSTIALPNLQIMNDGSTAIFSATSGTQTILQTDYYYLQVSGAEKILAGKTDVRNNFTFDNTNGGVLVDLDAFDMEIMSTGAISGADVNNYFIASGDGSLIMQVPATATDVVFPVGTSTNYNPVTLNVPTSSNADEFLVRTFDGIWLDYQGADPVLTGTQLEDDEVQQTWIITERVVGTTTEADVTLQWNAPEEGTNFDRTNSAVGFYNGTDWVGSATSAASASDPYTQTLTGATEFGVTPFGVGDEQSPVPVELICFTAKLQPEGGVLVEWATASELNNSHFLLQYTNDGRIWENLTRVTGHGTTTEMQEYAYFDGRPLKGTVCYRLKQVDYNGAFEYSKAACVEATRAGDISIYPNPVNAHENINISLGTDETVNAHVKIINMQGQVVKHIEINEAYTAHVQVNDLASGWYTIQVITPGNTTAKRLFILR